MQWTELARSLGASDPEDWVDDDAPRDVARAQLARFLFLREAMKILVSRNETSWIDNMIAAALRAPEAPLAGAGRVIVILREKGVADSEIAELIRATQAETIFELFCLLDGMDEPDPILEEAGLGDLDWGLFVTSDGKEPGAQQLTGLHESVLLADPDGHEMRPTHLD